MPHYHIVGTYLDNIIVEHAKDSKLVSDWVLMSCVAEMHVRLQPPSGGGNMQSVAGNVAQRPAFK